MGLIHPNSRAEIAKKAEICLFYAIFQVFYLFWSAYSHQRWSQNPIGYGVAPLHYRNHGIGLLL
jgi:hypothetical protein